MVIWHYSLSNLILSNRGYIFISKFRLLFYYFLGIKQKLSTIFYPQTNNETKLQNNIIELYLKLLLTMSRCKSILDVLVLYLDMLLKYLIYTAQMQKKFLKTFMPIIPFLSELQFIVYTFKKNFKPYSILSTFRSKFKTIDKLADNLTHYMSLAKTYI